MPKVGLLVRLEAKPGKEAELAAFLENALPLAAAEPATEAWFAVRLGPSTFAIFDTFPDDAGREAHIHGEIAKLLRARGPELLAAAPRVEKTEVLAGKR
jgi:quinol monooxygenase YgiN